MYFRQQEEHKHKDTFPAHIREQIEINFRKSIHTPAKRYKTVNKSETIKIALGYY